ncbi:unnamed protein product [Diatraea saccharalis]|uniref:Uncharacterized protein n=1 Tax=Diatraea saccharalis TaxID=40085 RepID=A0A9N9R9Y5_9NEOP|nr:unnamed protein product [Diatraea saccharalis]
MGSKRNEIDRLRAARPLCIQYATGQVQAEHSLFVVGTGSGAEVESAAPAPRTKHDKRVRPKTARPRRNRYVPNYLHTESTNAGYTCDPTWYRQVALSLPISENCRQLLVDCVVWTLQDITRPGDQQSTAAVGDCSTVEVIENDSLDERIDSLSHFTNVNRSIARKILDEHPARRTICILEQHYGCMMYTYRCYCQLYLKYLTVKFDHENTVL